MAVHAWMPGAPGGEFLPALARCLDDDVRMTDGDRPADADSVRVLISGVPAPEEVDGLPALTHVLIPYAGVPERTRALITDRTSLSLHNIHHNAAPTAELALTLLLAAAKRVVPFDRELRAGDWRSRYAEPTSITLEGRTALVLGFGAIGRRVARALRALEVEVIAVNRSGSGGEDDIAVHAVDALPGLWPQASLVVVCLPATDATRGMIDADAIAAMSPGTVLSNVGRGSLIDEDALFDALASGHLGAAGLDVWYQYPREEDARRNTPPANRPFGELHNVVLSPHRAGLTQETERTRAEHVAAQLNRLAAGDPMQHAVDLAHGY